MKWDHIRMWALVLEGPKYCKLFWIIDKAWPHMPLHFHLIVEIFRLYAAFLPGIACSTSQNTAYPHYDLGTFYFTAITMFRNDSCWVIIEKLLRCSSIAFTCSQTWHLLRHGLKTCRPMLKIKLKSKYILQDFLWIPSLLYSIRQREYEYSVNYLFNQYFFGFLCPKLSVKK